jgi:hypothetical protein
VQNLTKGSPTRGILLFSVPLYVGQLIAGTLRNPVVRQKDWK